MINFFIGCIVGVGVMLIIGSTIIHRWTLEARAVVLEYDRKARFWHWKYVELCKDRKRTREGSTPPTEPDGADWWKSSAD
jgi:hypothetical protein